MTALIKEDNAYVAAFAQALQVQSNEPAWLREFRETSFARFQSIGFPTVEEEEWKYTNVASIARSSLAPVVHLNGTALTK